MDADSQTSSHASAGALGWAAEKARWRDTVLRCPGLGDHRVVLARDSVACLACALELYVFLHLMIRDDGIPYYFIWLTNWTGMATVAYAVLHAWATRRAARLRDDVAYRDQSGVRDDDSTPVPAGVHALWALKCITPVAQLFITVVYWGVLWRPWYGPVSPHNVVAHGALYAVTLVDFATLNRFTLASFADLTNAYAFGAVYVCFNVAYTFVPGATNHRGDEFIYPITDWRSRTLVSVGFVVAAFAIVLPASWHATVRLTQLRDSRWFPDGRDGDRDGDGAERTAGDDGRGDARSFA